MKIDDTTKIKYKESDNYTIGETSVINNITIKSLYHYEKKNMLLPSNRDEITGYRYYSYSQFFIIDIIRRFKRCGVSLDDLSQMMISKDFNYSKTLLNIEIEKIDIEIQRLQSIKDDISFFKSFYDEMPKVMRNDDIIVSTHTYNHILAVPCSLARNYNEADSLLRNRIHSELFRPVKFFLPCAFLLDVKSFVAGSIKTTHRTCYLIRELDFKHDDYLFIETSQCLTLTIGHVLSKDTTVKIRDFINQFNLNPKYILCEEFYEEVTNVTKPLLRVKVIL